MSLFSTLNATDLMGAAAAKFAPLINNILASGASDEDKALAVIQAISASWLSEVHAELQQLNATLAKLADAYDISSGAVQVSISKKKDNTEYP